MTYAFLPGSSMGHGNMAMLLLDEVVNFKQKFSAQSIA